MIRSRTVRTLTWVAMGLASVAVAVAIYVARTWNRTWDAPLPDVQASTDPEIIKRGEYLVFGPAHCVECHTASSEAFEQYVETKVRPALVGGMPFSAQPLGTVYSKNLTPDDDTGIGRYSDGRVARVLRYSVLPDGRASVRPLMQYAEMSDQDLTAIVSFLRAQPPIRHEVPDNRWSLIGKIVKSLSPAFKPRVNVHAPAVAPPAAPTRARGEYLARSVGNCGGCHSPLNQMTLRSSGPEFSGGAPIEPRQLPGVDRTRWFQPPNLTPRDGSATTRFPDRETFVARFQRGGRKYPESPMPWDCFGRMTAEDLGALYEFFMSLPSTGPESPSDPTVEHSG
ncbi:MAG TPA: cytochrome c [Vicinamibacterales bacterium]